MNSIIQKAFNEEMEKAIKFYKNNKLSECFSHLERAHILGQRNAIPHTVNHWWMLKVGVRRKDFREIFGQIARILVAGIGSIIGRVPFGNTGGSNVGIMQKMAISNDLLEIFKQAGKPE
jgi:hypothetical protein